MNFQVDKFFISGMATGFLKTKKGPVVAFSFLCSVLVNIRLR
jgi:hypothetical protein